MDAITYKLVEYIVDYFRQWGKADKITVEVNDTRITLTRDAMTFVIRLTKDNLFITVLNLEMPVIPFKINYQKETFSFNPNDGVFFVQLLYLYTACSYDTLMYNLHNIRV